MITKFKDKLVETQTDNKTNKEEIIQFNINKMQSMNKVKMMKRHNNCLIRILCRILIKMML